MKFIALIASIATVAQAEGGTKGWITPCQSKAVSCNDPKQCCGIARFDPSITTEIDAFGNHALTNPYQWCYDKTATKFTHTIVQGETLHSTGTLNINVGKKAYYVF